MKSAFKKVILYNGINRSFFSGIDPINLGLLAISSVLKEKGYQTILIPNIEAPQSLKLLKKELKSALMVGVSCMTGDPLINAIKFSQIVKKLRPKIPIVWGGYHVSMDYQNAMKEDYIDYVVRAQGEKTVIELAKAIEKKAGFNKILGLVYRQHGQIKVNSERPIEEVDQFPMYDYQLYSDSIYPDKIELLVYSSSRGCPFDCTFCSVSKFYGKKHLSYKIDRFFSDIAYLAKTYNPKTISFWDDNFFIDLKRVNAFLDEYIDKKYTFNWWAQSRAGSFAKENKELLNRLKRCNCQSISMGAESGSPKILTILKKHLNPQDVLDSCKNISKYGILPAYGFMSGLPGETMDDLNMTIDLIRQIFKINPETNVQFYGFLPFPGTAILEDCAKYGFIYPDAMSDWSIYEFHSFISPWITKKHQRLIKRLIWMMAFISPRTVPSTGRWYIDIPLWFLHQDAKWRLRHNFYQFAYEWDLYYTLYKRHYQTNNS